MWNVFNVISKTNLCKRANYHQMILSSKMLIIPIFIVLLIPLIPNSDAEVNLENKSFLSNDGNLAIDFGKNIIQQKKSSTKIIPTLDIGIIQTPTRDYLLDFTDDVSVKVYGDSFVVKSLKEPSILIYARNTGGSNYDVNVYTVDNGLIQHSFTGKLEQISEIEQSDPDILQPNLPEMKILTKQTDRTYWKYSYLLSARVYDAELNKINDFNQNWGYIPGIDMTVEIFNQNNELLKRINGKTDNAGFFEVDYFIEKHLAPKGTYTVKITADNGQTQTSKTLPMIVMGDKSSSGGP